MKCDLKHDACVNCGGGNPDGECPAEAHIDELLAMQEGRAPSRCVKITWIQTQTLAAQQPDLLTKEERHELFGEDDPTLIGNRIAELTKAIGIPPCGGCNGRREWLNKAHSLVRDWFSSKTTPDL